MKLKWQLSGSVGVLALGLAGDALAYGTVSEQTVVDLSPTVSMAHKQYWPGGQRHHQPIIVDYIRQGPGPLNADLLIVDENTGTQTDCPPHMMPAPDSGLPNAGYWGNMTCDKVPAWQFLGEVVKVDGTKILDQAPNGVSPIFTVDMIKQTEQQIGRSLGPGDAVLYWSRYDDRHDQPGDAGRRLLDEPVAGTAPAFPAPNWDAEDYIGTKGVVLVGLDSPSIGAFGQPDYVMRGTDSLFQNPKALESHLGLFKYGGIDVEGLMNLDQVPNGSLFVGLPIKHMHSPTGETRAAAITDKELASELMKAVRMKQVVDLSVLNAMDTPVAWTGAGIGNYGFPYHSVDPVNGYTGPAGPYWVNTHMLDSRTGTHIAPPAHYGTPPGFDRSKLSDEVRGWLTEFEQKFGKLKDTERTADKVPVHWLMGPARVIDVQQLVGTTEPSSWPASPKITVDDIKAHEQQYGAIKAGEVVIFNTGHSTTTFRPVERGRLDYAMKAPLDGKAEGWPAPTPEAIAYLADKGVRHVAIDAPIMGSVDPKERAFTYWAGVNADMVFSEYLTDVGALPPTGAFYIFLNTKIEDTHGGPGRAIAILPTGGAGMRQAQAQ
jgi:kynurenine formamidase